MVTVLLMATDGRMITRDITFTLCVRERCDFGHLTTTTTRVCRVRRGRLAQLLYLHRCYAQSAVAVRMELLDIGNHGLVHG